MDGFWPTFVRRKQAPARWPEAIGDQPIRSLPAPRTVILPLQDRPATPFQCLVKPKDKVVTGQKIGEMGKSPYAVPILATRSGRVREIEVHPIPSGSYAPCVVIDAEEVEEPSQAIALNTPRGLERLLEAGIPLDYESLCTGKTECLIVNGTEFEPNLGVRHHILKEMGGSIAKALADLMEIFSIPLALVCLEKNQSSLIQRLSETAKDYRGLEVYPTSRAYPETGQLYLIQEVRKKRNGSSQRVAFIDIALLPAVYEALHHGVPFFERVIGISGSGIPQPGNIQVTLGTTFGEVIKNCGGALDRITQIIMGGVLMGISQPNPMVPVTWRTPGIMALVALNLMAVHPSRMYVEGPCVRCAKCVDVCPASILPSLIAAYCRKRRFGEAVEKGLFQCIDCGLCSYVCPAQIPLAQILRETKSRRELRSIGENLSKGNAG